MVLPSHLSQAEHILTPSRAVGDMLFANCPPIPNKAHFQIHLFGAEFAHAEDRLKALILEKKATKLQQILEKQILKRSTGD